MERFLTNVQRKQLHDLLVKAGVDTNVTSWSNDGMGWTRSGCETLHAGLCHFMIAPNSDGDFSVHFMPSWDGGGKKGLSGKPWKEIIGVFEFWSYKVKEELDQPDPWGTFSIAALGATPNHEKDNAPFTHKEAEHVSASINKLLQQIREELPEYATVEKHFTPQFERLADQARNGAGRIDWKNQLVGLLINLVVALGLAPDQAALLWSYWVLLVNNALLP